jgi:hypothetical protein
LVARRSRSRVHRRPISSASQTPPPPSAIALTTSPAFLPVGPVLIANSRPMTPAILTGVSTRILLAGLELHDPRLADAELARQQRCQPGGQQLVMRLQVRRSRFAMKPCRGRSSPTPLPEHLQRLHDHHPAAQWPLRGAGQHQARVVRSRTVTAAPAPHLTTAAYRAAFTKTDGNNWADRGRARGSSACPALCSGW